MNTLKGLSLTALLLAGSMTFIAPTQANPEAPTETTTQALIEAPVTDLTYPSTTITTSPAPTTEAPTQPLPEAPVEALIEAPTVPLIEALPEAPVEALPSPAPEQPTAAPTAPVEAIVEAPAVDPYSGNPIVDCEARGLVTAEDYSCVSVDFWLIGACATLTLHGMEYGIARHCYWNEATSMVPHLEYVDSSTEPRESGSAASVKYPGIFHNFIVPAGFPN